MIRILAADIGGTKTLLQLSEFNDRSFRLLYEERYSSQDYASFDELLTAFLRDTGQTGIDHACFAIAGPVSTDGSSANVTNLPWQLQRDRLVKTYNINHVTLINDFHAVAAGIDTLSGDELQILQQGQPQTPGTQLVIGAGTGLGVALRIWTGSAYQVLATEAGHAGFAPANEQQQRLLSFLASRYTIVSREQVLSGQGLVNIYQFICEEDTTTARDIDAAQISHLADQGDDHCRRALALFFDIYGSECGNLALATLPFAGIYIAGGIAAKNLGALVQSGFIAAFCHKSKMQGLLTDMPVFIIKNEAVGLSGARHVAALNVNKP